MQIKVPLYRRLGPGQQFPSNGFVVPQDGFINSLGTVKGQDIDGIDDWHFDANNFHYWAGGLQQGAQSPIPVVPDFEWWVNNYGIQQFWNKTRGAGMKIALLDTGLSNHTDLACNTIDGWDFVNNNKNFWQNDTGHCTEMAGIISGQGKQVWGISPDSTLWVGRVMDAGGNFPVKNGIKNIGLLNTALEYIANNNLFFDVINISIEIDPRDYDATYQSKLEQNIKNVFIKSGGQTIFVASVGNTGTFFTLPLASLPASAAGVFSVAAVDITGNRSPFSSFSNKIDLAAPGSNITSLIPVNTSKAGSGTSQAAAYTSAVFALAKAYWLKTKDTQTKPFDATVLQDFFRTSITPKNDVKQYGAGIINPINIKTKIDNL